MGSLTGRVPEGGDLSGILEGMMVATGGMMAGSQGGRGGEGMVGVGTGRGQGDLHVKEHILLLGLQSISLTRKKD